MPVPRLFDCIFGRDPIDREIVVGIAVPRSGLTRVGRLVAIAVGLPRRLRDGGKLLGMGVEAWIAELTDKALFELGPVEAWTGCTFANVGPCHGAPHVSSFDLNHKLGRNSFAAIGVPEDGGENLVRR